MKIKDILYTRLDPVLSPELIDRSWDYALAKADHSGIHGPAHWIRVILISLFLARSTKADRRLIFLFGTFHDMLRENDGFDPYHGSRAAAEVQSGFDLAPYNLSPKARTSLFDAIRYHTIGELSDDANVATCWDADRLDLLRCGKKINRAYLSYNQPVTAAAIAYAGKLQRNTYEL